MQRVMLRAKIHGATVTASDLHAVGSLTLDPDLLEAADIREYEQVAVADVNNGERFDTYVISGEPGSGQVKANGATARLVQEGDPVIIFSYSSFDAAELDGYAPKVVQVDARNRVVPVGGRTGAPADG